MTARALSRPGNGRVLLGLQLAGVGALALALVGLVPFSLPDRVQGAANHTARLATQYDTLRDSDFDEVLLPVAMGMAARDGACGVVISGVGNDAANRRVVLWQRSTGSCARTQVGRAGQIATAPGPGVVVEVAAEQAGVRRDVSAVSLAALPRYRAGARTR